MTTRRNKVLIVDFDPAFLGVMEQLLEARGWDTTTTWDMCEAQDLLLSQPFAVAIAGHHPPAIQAGEILKLLKAKPNHTRCIVALADSTHPFEAEYLASLGAYAVVSKWNQRELVDAVQNAANSPPGVAAD